LDDVLSIYDCKFTPLYSKYVSIFGIKPPLVIDELVSVPGDIVSEQYNRAYNSIERAAGVCAALLWKHFKPAVLTICKKTGEDNIIKECYRILQGFEQEPRTPEIFEEIEDVLDRSEFSMMEYTSRAARRRRRWQAVIEFMLTAMAGLCTAYAGGMIFG